jgi:hypothetical protein
VADALVEAWRADARATDGLEVLATEFPIVNDELPRWPARSTASRGSPATLRFVKASGELVDRPRPAPWSSLDDQDASCQHVNECTRLRGPDLPSTPAAARYDPDTDVRSDVPVGRSTSATP